MKRVWGSFGALKVAERDRQHPAKARIHPSGQTLLDPRLRGDDKKPAYAPYAFKKTSTPAVTAASISSGAARSTTPNRMRL
jgi:hypothetical protein